MIDTLLVLNTGSSSLKFQVFGYRDLDVLMQGKVTGIGGEPSLTARLAGGAPVHAPVAGSDHDAALSAVIALIDTHDDDWRIVGIVHRVVHGGRAFVSPVVVTPDVIAALEALTPLAPLHQPHNLGLGAACRPRTRHCVFRHGLPRRPCRSFFDIRDRQGSPRPRHPALRLSRSVL